MNKQMIEELLYYLSDQRKTYTYFKDKYCMFLLQNMMTENMTASQLKKGQYSHFCNKPVIKNWLAQYGSHKLDPKMLTALWQSKLYHFNITLGRWGGDHPSWQQTCRKGYNLVLQLNFTKSHDRFYDKVTIDDSQPFIYGGHPVHKERNTLGWSRIDISDDWSEVLIEEIQNDWLREAQHVFNRLLASKNDECYHRYGINPKHDLFKKYYDKTIKPLMKIWDEAILCATLEFLHKDIGVKNIYYYDYDTGSKLKSYCYPPRSLYTKLPKKFGFETVTQAPQFIADDKYSARKLKRIASPQWHYLSLEEKKYA